MNTTFTISGQIVDLLADRIFPGTLCVENGVIKEIREEPIAPMQYVLPGFVDAHVHIESSMLVPSEFARLATCHGTVATVSDPHEIANVLGMEGVRFMIDNGKRVPFKFFFGAPSCVPATTFETSGHTLDTKDIARLMEMDDIYYLAEMMNYPGVLAQDAEILRKIAAAKQTGKPIDGHAPNLSGEDLKRYVAAGISTDHECFTEAEAMEKISLGMKIHIREGSAAKNFEALIPLMKSHPGVLMFCSDDKHPDDLVRGHVNQLVKRAVAKGYDTLDVLKAASLNAIRHYGLPVGLLQQGDDADFIVTDNLTDFNVLQTYIKGVLVAENGKPCMERITTETPNFFNAFNLQMADLAVSDKGKSVKVIECIDGQLITRCSIEKPSVRNGWMVSDPERDLLKMIVLNRYQPGKPAIAFIRNFGLKRGAIASSVAHDSHNIVAVGACDEDIVRAVNLLIAHKGGVVAYDAERSALLPLPVAGLMSNEDGYRVAQGYETADRLAHDFGTTLTAPFMTLAFMALLVIPELKLSDKGLFDVTRFAFTELEES
ncbi:MAG: adenine deaminase [Candidatus Limimorpha sp.]